MHNIVRCDGGWFPNPFTPMTGIIKILKIKRKKKERKKGRKKKSLRILTNLQALPILTCVAMPPLSYSANSSPLVSQTLKAYGDSTEITNIKALFYSVCLDGMFSMVLGERGPSRQTL